MRKSRVVSLLLGTDHVTFSVSTANPAAPTDAHVPSFQTWSTRLFMKAFTSALRTCRRGSRAGTLPGGPFPASYGRSMIPMMISMKTKMSIRSCTPLSTSISQTMPVRCDYK